MPAIYRLTAYLVALGWMGVSLFSVQWAIGDMLLASASKNWPTVAGQISSARVVSHHAGRTTHHEALVRYQYTIGKRTLTGDRVAFGTVVGDEKWAKSLVDRYRPGQQVPVHVDPEDPQRAVLEPRLLSNEVYWVPPAMVLSWLFLGWLWLRQRKRSQ